VDGQALGWKAPRLGTGGRYYGVPVRLLWWAGLAVASLMANLVAVALANDTGLSTAALLPQTWLWWLPEAGLCAFGAWFRPGQLDARTWLLVWLVYLVTPKRAVYKPDTRSPLAHWR
jgi:hypothetical protein